MLIQLLIHRRSRMSRQMGQVSPLVLVKGGITALLLIWMATSIASVIWRLIPQPDLAALDASENQTAFEPAKSGKTLPSVDIASLKSIALFGEEKTIPVEVVEEKPPEPVQEQVEETRLNLQLVGSFASDPQDNAYAIIASGKKQALYRVDEEIAGLADVKLVQVFPEKVILYNRGRRESLYMYPEGEPISSSLAPAISPQLAAAVVNDDVQPNAGLTPSEKVARSIKQQNRLEKISDAIRLSRKTKDGKMIGFRVLPGRNRAAFEQTGLKLNDVIIAIDGTPMDNLKVAQKTYQEKRNATQASLTVLRGDQELSIDVDINNISTN